MGFRGSTIFVTGGAGFIGSAVVRHLLDDTEAFVVNIDKLVADGSRSRLPGQTHWPGVMITVGQAETTQRVLG